MSGWPFLLVAAAAVAGAYYFGWPPLRDQRARQRRDINAERYLAWRGRADRRPTGTGFSPAEQRRLWTAAGLLLTAVMAVLYALAQP